MHKNKRMYTFAKFVVLLQYNQPATNFIKTVYDSFLYILYIFYAIYSDQIEISTCILYKLFSSVYRIKLD